MGNASAEVESAVTGSADQVVRLSPGVDFSARSLDAAGRGEGVLEQSGADSPRSAKSAVEGTG